MSYYLMHRDWMDKRIFEREPFDRRSAWCWLIEHATFADAKNLKRGQLRITVRGLAAAWKWEPAKVQRYLSAAQHAEMIECIADTHGTTITICNYETYQRLVSIGDTSSDTQPIHTRYTPDTPYKEGKKEDSDSPDGESIKVRRNSDYEYAGKLIRLKRDDFDRWKHAYSAIPDFLAELETLDDFYDSSLEGVERKTWFIRCSRALGNKHQAYLKQQSGAINGTRKSAVEKLWEGAYRAADAFEARERADCSTVEPFLDSG